MELIGELGAIPHYERQPRLPFFLARFLSYLVMHTMLRRENDG